MVWVRTCSFSSAVARVILDGKLVDWCPHGHSFIAALLRKMMLPLRDAGSREQDALLTRRDEVQGQREGCR